METHYQQQHARKTVMTRWVLGAFVFLAIVWPTLLQPALDVGWSFLRHSTVYQLSFFETMQTALLYINMESFYIRRVRSLEYPRVDIRAGKENQNRPRMKAMAKRLRELFIYVSPLFLLDFILIKKYDGVALDAIKASGNRLDSHSVSKTFLVLNVHKFAMNSPIQLVCREFDLAKRSGVRYLMDRQLLAASYQS